MPMRRRAWALIVGALLGATGCSRHDDAQPRAVTSDEQQRLNHAAAMLDNQSVSANALADDGTANDSEEDSQ